MADSADSVGTAYDKAQQRAQIRTDWIGCSAGTKKTRQPARHQEYPVTKMDDRSGKLREESKLQRSRKRKVIRYQKKA